MIEVANKDFDCLAGEGEQCYPSHLIEEDISKITEEDPVKKIKKFRDKYICY